MPAECLTIFIGPITILLLLALIYHHAGYPLVLAWAARQRPAPPIPPPVAAEDLPFVTIVIPAMNEARVIAAKLDNLAQLDYPAERYRVILASDGSTDQTVALAQAAAARWPACRIEIRDFAINRGKVAVLNEVLSGISHGLVCLTDASALLSADALLIAAAHFVNETIGVVAGTYRFAQSGSAGESSYWRYQTEVKRRESLLGGVIGVHGAGYIIRADLFEPLEADTINDDFILPMRIVARGYRAIYEPRIIATELETASMAQDHRRRRRIAAGNMQQLIRLAALLHPRHGAVAFMFASGKTLRVLSPYLMVAVLVGSAIEAARGSGWFALLLAGQVAVYAVAAAQQILPPGTLPKPAVQIHYLIAGHLMALIGGTRYLFGRQSGRWHRVDDLSAAALAPVTHISPATSFAKRLFDIIGALIGLLIGAVVAGPVILAIRLTSPGPVVFRQMRIGRALADRTELFVMLKFRTMYVDAEARSGPVWATKNDPRITPVGRFLRKTRLDEIPQLINVLRGEMSLVGPRPERPGINNRLEDAIPFFAERTFGVRPGITGLAQVNQGYDETLDDVRNKVLYDHAYSLAIMGFWSWLTTDLFILWKTVAVVVGGRGQ